MLECYFDDSGTHGGSKVVAWGGLIGSPENFDRFALEWRKLLGSPLPGKPALKKMHLTSLRSGKGEFFGYNQGEIDLLTKKFRDIIVESGLECIAYIALASDWLRASTAEDRLWLRGPKDFAFMGILTAVEKLALSQGAALSCYFDIGAQDEVLRIQQASRTIFNPATYEKTNLIFSEVEKVVALQGADMIVYEAYHYGMHLLDPNYPENPHFIDLRNRTNVAFMSLHEDAIAKWLHHWRAVMGFDR